MADILFWYDTSLNHLIMCVLPYSPSLKNLLVSLEGESLNNFIMKKWLYLLLFVIIWWSLASLIFLWLLGSPNPEEKIRQQIIELDKIKTQEITSIQEKQNTDAELLSWLQAEVKTIQWRMNWRSRCIDILSWSLWSINMIDCEAKMQEQSSGNVLQATFQ